jgi:hypothetical protein
MLHFRIASAAVVAGTTLHLLHVRKERNKQPCGRLLQFTPGSTDDMIADRLKTGDIVLFARDWTLYAALGAVVSVARVTFSGVPYDQAGVIVRKQGVPFVLEHTFSGVKLRRYDHRVQCSRSSAILLRPIALRLTPEQLSAVDGLLEDLLPAGTPAAAAATGAGDGYDPETGARIPVVTPALLGAGVFGALAELARFPVNPAANASVDLVARVYGALGLQLASPPPSPTGTAGAAAAAPAPRRAPQPPPLAMTDLVPPSQPWRMADSGKPVPYEAALRVRELLS